ncbi:MAG TPA: hypothetical protein PK530_14040, partial [Anaerolineales bacterium]|nr:hypothetical protein [Anaerolineales bacterium]
PTWIGSLHLFARRDEKRMTNLFSPGLCASCTHARTVQNDRGSVFWLCEASKFNPRLLKYPRLPVFKCPAYQPENRVPHSARGEHETSQEDE